MNREIHSSHYYFKVLEEDNENSSSVKKKQNFFEILSDSESISCIPIKHLPLKRLFDLFFSVIILFFGAPLYLFIALGIKLSSQGPVLYSQGRVGRGGEIFRCYKFRTMIPEADSFQDYLIQSDSKFHEEWSSCRKLKNDPRVTKFGYFLRKTSLDELPQFWNVLKGDLSVVGPRPVVIEEVVEYFGPKARKILSIRPGITGLWQVSGRSNLSYHRRIELDEQYVDDFSMMLDFKLIAKTIPSMLFPTGAY